MAFDSSFSRSIREAETLDRETGWAFCFLEQLGEGGRLKSPAIDKQASRLKMRFTF